MLELLSFDTESILDYFFFCFIWGDKAILGLSCGGLRILAGVAYGRDRREKKLTLRDGAWGRAGSGEVRDPRLYMGGLGSQKSPELRWRGGAAAMAGS